MKTESSRAPRPGTLALLTSGGDCADHLDAVILVVVRRIAGYGWRVIGVRNGTLGLMKRPVDAVVLSLDAADGTLLRRGGTILGSSNTGDSRI